MCGIGLFWSVVTLVTFVLGSFGESFTKINKFQSWDPEYQAEFIFSCCIAPLVWAAALVLAVYDRANLRQVRSTGGGLDGCASHWLGAVSSGRLSALTSCCPPTFFSPFPTPTCPALRQATATAQVSATSMKIGGDVQLEVEPESLPKQAVLV